MDTGYCAGVEVGLALAFYRKAGLGPHILVHH